MAREGSLLVSIIRLKPFPRLQDPHAVMLLCPPDESSCERYRILLACYQAGDPRGVAPLGPSCHRCASAVLAAVPDPTVVWALATDAVLSKPLEITAESTATPQTPHRSRGHGEVAGKLVIDRCERPLVDACQQELKMEEERQLRRWKADMG